MWHVSSRSGVATLRTAIHLLLTYLRHVSTDLHDVQNETGEDAAESGEQERQQDFAEDPRRRLVARSRRFIVRDQGPCVPHRPRRGTCRLRAAE